MTEKPRGSSVKRLVAVWVGYWVALGVTTFGSFSVIAWKLSRTSGNRATISAGFDNWVVKISAQLDGATQWAGSASLATIALFVAGPPLVAWLVWLARRRRFDEASPASAPPALADGARMDPDRAHGERQATRTPQPR